MGHPVNWFQIVGKDHKKLIAFYKKVFDWTITSGPDASFGMVKEEPGGIAGGIGPTMDGTSSVTVYVDVDDVVSALETIEKAGGKKALDPMDLPPGMGAIAGFTDPEGNWVGLWQKTPLGGASSDGGRKKKAPSKAVAKESSAAKAPASKAPASKAKPSAAKPTPTQPSAAAKSSALKASKPNASKPTASKPSASKASKPSAPKAAEPAKSSAPKASAKPSKAKPAAAKSAPPSKKPKKK